MLIEAGRIIYLPNLGTGLQTNLEGQLRGLLLALINSRGYWLSSDNSYTRIKDVKLSYIFSFKRLLD